MADIGWGIERSADNWALETVLRRTSEPNKKCTGKAVLFSVTIPF
jgi:hypothetical protein